MGSKLIYTAIISFFILGNMDFIRKSSNKEFFIIYLGMNLIIFFFVNKIVNYINRKIEISKISEQEKFREEKRREELREKELYRKQEDIKIQEDLKKQEELRKQNELKQNESNKKEKQDINDYLVKWKSNLRQQNEYRLSKSNVDFDVRLKAEKILKNEINDLISSIEYQRLSFMDVKKLCSKNTEYIINKVLHNAQRQNESRNNSLNNSLDRHYNRCTGICSECRRDECIEEKWKSR